MDKPSRVSIGLCLRSRGRRKNTFVLDRKREKLISMTIREIYLNPERPTMTYLIEQVRARCARAELPLFDAFAVFAFERRYAPVDPVNSVSWHSQRRRSFVLAPHRNRRTKKRAVYLLIVTPGDFPAECAFKLAKGHGRKTGGIVVLPRRWIGEVDPG